MRPPLIHKAPQCGAFSRFGKGAPERSFTAVQVRLDEKRWGISRLSDLVKGKPAGFSFLRRCKQRKTYENFPWIFPLPSMRTIPLCENDLSGRGRMIGLHNNKQLLRKKLRSGCFFMCLVEKVLK